jgi:hypothetical protein
MEFTYGFSPINMMVAMVFVLNKFPGIVRVEVEEDIGIGYPFKSRQMSFFATSKHPHVNRIP